MDWDDLSYFILLVQQQTLTACAETLGVQHSTVSRRIDHLERSLSLKLFDRLGRRYSLTQEGEQLYIQAIEIQKEMLTFERMAIDQNTMQGKVVISAPPVLANELLIQTLPAFHHQYPDITIHLLGDLHISDLYRKEADIALRLQRPTEEDLLIRTLSHIHYGFYAHKDYFQNTPAKLWKLIEFQANQRIMNWISSLVNVHDYRIVLSSNDLYVTYSSVCEKLGIAVLPYFLAAKNPDLLPVNPITKTIMTANDIENAEKDYLTDNNFIDDDLFSKEKGLEKSIPLIHSKPLYLVMHPDIRRSARVRVVAKWLGSVL